MVSDLRLEVEAARGILPDLNPVQSQYWTCLYEDEQKRLAAALERLTDDDRKAVTYVLNRYLYMVVTAVAEVATTAEARTSD
jgi:hypothetical protein